MNNKFDQLLNTIREGEPAAAAVAEARDRVQQKLFGPGAAGVEQIRGCEDFQSLIPAYLQRTLSDSRRMLLEDHIRECIPCRRVAHGEKPRNNAPIVISHARKPAGQPRWAIAAAALISVGASAYAANYFFGPQAGVQATVQSVEGILYKSTANGSVAIGDSTELRNGEEIRTTGNSRAAIRLADGSRVEMNERAEIAVTRNWGGTTVNVERGHIIVQAATQKTGRLYVAAGDTLVSVKGTIFSVNRGTVGSRVSVVEGQVQVDRAGRSESLKPGDQSTSSEALGKVPVEAEVAWSKDSARYLALLGELNTLQKRLELLPPNGLRYQSRLLLFTPEDTKLFVALPNMQVQLVEARRIFDERLKASAVLREWWNDPRNANLRRDFDNFIDLAKEITSALGEEIVIAISGQGSEMHPVLIAEARNPKGIISLMERYSTAAHGKLPYSVKNGLVLVAENPARLASIEAVVAGGGSRSTSFRQRIQQAYQSGAGWLVCANMEQIFPVSVKNSGIASNDLGLNTVQYLVLERRDVSGKTDNRVSLSFQGERKGLASFLGAPGPMGSLNFVSPDAGLAASFVVKQPRAMVDELMRIANGSDKRFYNQVAEFEGRTGLRILDDLAAPLGSEATVAIDGPIFPNPSWKLILEVNSPTRLQATMERLLEIFNQSAPPQSGKATLTREQVSNQAFYKITFEKLPFEAHYTFIDSYMVAAASRVLLTQAIRNRDGGYTLPRSDKFRAQLAYSTDTNFSAVVYHNLGGMLGPLVDQVQGVANLSEEQKQAMKLASDSQPGVIAFYGHTDRITASTTGNLPGVNLGVLAAGGPGGLFDLLRYKQ